VEKRIWFRFSRHAVLNHSLTYVCIYYTYILLYGTISEKRTGDGGHMGWRINIYFFLHDRLVVSTKLSSLNFNTRISCLFGSFRNGCRRASGSRGRQIATGSYIGCAEIANIICVFRFFIVASIILHAKRICIFSREVGRNNKTTPYTLFFRKNVFNSTPIP